MKLSVAYTFEHGLIEKLGKFPEVKEIYGKLTRDFIGGGRSSYTLPQISFKMLNKAVKTAHSHSIKFNYLINGAALDGTEQTRKGRNRIRKFLNILKEIGVDALTVASPFLLKLIKKEHPWFKVRVSAFACVDSPHKARQWEEMGADTICISAISCNRNFTLLESLRKSVRCDLQLLVNTSCLQHCAYELTHMNLLTQSSRSTHKLKGFCLDYCFLHCSRKRLQDPVLYIRSIWIRPEDLTVYEKLGYDNFKIVERSCPGDLLVKRVRAYAERNFDGNLMELVGPIAQIKKEPKSSGMRYIKMLITMVKPWHIKIRSMFSVKKYIEEVMIHDFSYDKSPLCIDNKKLDGFIDGLLKKNCSLDDCENCSYCASWFKKAVRIDESYRIKVLRLADSLESGLADGSLW